MKNAASSLRRSVYALAVVTIMSPLAALAATPQQIVDATLQRLSTSQPASVSGEVKLTVTDKPTAKTGSVSTGSVSFSFNGRSVPGTNAIPNTEGDLSITSFESSGMGVSIPKIENPGSIEWKAADGTGYARVSDVAGNIKSFLTMLSVNADAWIGTWLKISPSDIPACTNQAVCGTAAIVAAQAQAEISAITKNPIKITRIEKRWKASNGDSMLRVRGAINATVLTNLQNREIKAIDLKDKQRAAKIKEINARFAEVRKVASSIQLALNINETDSTVERAEVGITNKQPVKSCTTNKWKITTCKTTSNVTTTMTAGFNFAPGKSDSIVVPASFITVDDLIKMLKK